MEDKELKRIAAASSHNLEIVAFTKLKEIDPIFYDASYFCIPEESGKKAYQLLTKALEDTQTVGIGTLMMQPARLHRISAAVSTRTCAAYYVFFERNSAAPGIRGSGTRQLKTAGNKTDGAADCFIDRTV